MAEREVHLRDYLAVIRKHDFIVVVSFLLIFGAALGVSLYMPREYEATATIEIQSTSEPSGLPSSVQSIMLGDANQVSMETVCRRFASRPILAETVWNLKRAMPEIAVSLLPPEALASRIWTNIVPDTMMIEVAVRMRRDEGGAERAVRVANELVSVMQEHRSGKTDAKIAKRQGFIDNKMSEVMSEIDNLDQVIKQFKLDNGLPRMWSMETGDLVGRVSALRNAGERYRDMIVVEQTKLADVEARLKEEPEWIEYSQTFSRDAVLDKYRTDLVDVQQKLAEVLTNFGEDHPRVKSLEAQISRLQGDMKGIAQQADLPSSKTKSLNPVYQSLLNRKMQGETNIIIYKLQAEMADSMLDELDDGMVRTLYDVSEKQFLLGKMSQEITYRMAVYESLLGKKLAAEIWANENSDDSFGRTKGGIEIVDTAQPDGLPVSPRVKFIGVIAGLVGLVVGLAMAFLAEYFENTYQSPDEAGDALDMPVLGIIPTMKAGKADALPLLESSMSAEAESFKTLVTNIEFSSLEKPYQGLLVTSSAAGEGKSFAAANLAVAMAQARAGLGSGPAAQVILLDCDMRRAAQHELFDADNRTGLVNLLVGNAELESVIQDTSIPNLKLITCGPTPPNPVELLKSQRLDEILGELRESYGMLICDSPPVLPVADALVLASKLDGVLFLADLGHTQREVIQQAKEQLSKLDVPLLGLVCNRVGTAKYNSYYHHKSPVGKTTV